MKVQYFAPFMQVLFLEVEKRRKTLIQVICATTLKQRGELEAKEKQLAQETVSQIRKQWKIKSSSEKQLVLIKKLVLFIIIIHNYDKLYFIVFFVVERFSIPLLVSVSVSIIYSVILYCIHILPNWWITS